MNEDDLNVWIVKIRQEEEYARLHFVIKLFECVHLRNHLVYANISPRTLPKLRNKKCHSARQ